MFLLIYLYITYTAKIARMKMTPKNKNFVDNFFEAILYISLYNKSL